MHQEFPCKFFYMGKCQSQDNCRFSHQLPFDDAKILLDNVFILSYLNVKQFSDKLKQSNTINDDDMNLQIDDLIGVNIESEICDINDQSFKFYE